jgi:hypothetical protein
MAWTFSLRDGTTTLALNDQTNYVINYGGVSMPPPPRRTAFGGASLLRHGEDLLERVYGNRTVTIAFQIKGTSQDNLIANVNAIHQMLEKASEFSRVGLGAQVQLRQQWDSATNSSDFDVISGILDLGTGIADVAHFVADRIVTSILTLTCKPFILGTAETIENFVKDPNFAVAGTALADWTDASTATGTGSRVVTDYIFKGAEHMLTLAMTDSGAGQQHERRSQILTDVDAAETWSFSTYVEIEALSDAYVVMVIAFEDGSNNEIARYEDISDTVLGGTAVEMLFEALVPPTGTTQARIDVRLRSTAVDATGTVKVGAWMAVQASSIPTTWVSGRDVTNHFDDDGQDHLNYIDIYNVQGDIPALLQVKAAEVETHSEMWFGARHGSRMEDAGLWFDFMHGVSPGTSTASAPSGFSKTDSGDTSDATSSDAFYHYSRMTKSASSTGTLAADTYWRRNYTIATPPKGQYRALVSVAWESNVSGVDDTDFSFGMSWTYGSVTLLDDTNPDTGSFVGLPSGLTEQAFAYLDLGTITVPPVITPDGMTDSSLIIKIFFHWLNTTNQTFGSGGSERVEFRIDNLFLLPIDMGAGYLSKTSGTDVVLLDSRGSRPGFYLLNTSDVVQSFPSDQQGTPPEAHIDGTRIYMLCMDSNVRTIADSFHTAITVVPRYLNAIGA